MDFSVGPSFCRVYPNEVTLSQFNGNLYLSLSLFCNCTYLIRRQANGPPRFAPGAVYFRIILTFISQRCNNAGTQASVNHPQKEVGITQKAIFSLQQKLLTLYVGNIKNRKHFRKKMKVKPVNSAYGVGTKDSCCHSIV